MTPEQYKLAKQEKLIDQIAKERIAELTQKLKKAWEAGDKRQIARLNELIKINQEMVK